MISWRSTLASKGKRHRLGPVVLIVSLQCLSGQATITYCTFSLLPLAKALKLSVDACRLTDYTEILRLVGITDTTKGEPHLASSRTRSKQR